MGVDRSIGVETVAVAFMIFLFVFLILFEIFWVYFPLYWIFRVQQFGGSRDEEEEEDQLASIHAGIHHEKSVRESPKNRIGLAQRDFKSA